MRRRRFNLDGNGGVRAGEGGREECEEERGTFRKEGEKKREREPF